ncbi:MAG: oxygen-independent coproporphyrinogen III oxidase [Bacteroidales bacterium]|jgi:oxygen-independent coproporphyrinogen-3 oxidase|nr:oxygen-independent coproporphyrinogen III oxidase [Bacteroidales bacterium]
MMDFQILKKFNKPGPRYTSYPPANFFHTEYNNDNYIQNLKSSNSQKPENISLYIHIPFCPRLCHFCGCNTTIMQKQDSVSKYIDAVIKEIKTVAQYLDTNRIVTQIHWGGGTPNSIPLEFLAKVMQVIYKTFTVDKKAEIAMECSPAYLEFEDIASLKEIGFNRLSLGVQDFNENVLKIVNRQASKHPIEDLVSTMKDLGFEGVNIDLIYGLPGQTPESFTLSIERAIKISPDRIVTFSYAHVPWVKSAQKQLEKIGLPSPEGKLEMFGIAYNLLTQNGYISIGMDHYAKPNDELSLALKNKKLHRNFQGYCTKETTGQIYGFGSSSISQMYGAYTQNQKNTYKYIEDIEKNGLSIERGYELNNNDLICRSVINEIMCNGFLDFDSIASEFSISTEEIKKIVDYDPSKLDQFKENNLLSIDDGKIKLNPEGFFVVRNIAMEFDPLLNVGEDKYSKTV